MGHPRFTVPLTPCNLPLFRCPVPREAASRRILIMRLGAYGDILMATPLLAALRTAYPDAHLTWLAGPTESQAIDANPHLDTLAKIAAAMSAPVVVAAGALLFREAAALIDRARLLVSGDTGPMHVAAALGTPQVALFGATSPAWYGPRTDRAISLLHSVPCGPCDKKECSQTGENFLRCLKLITVDEALAAAGRLLGIPA